MGVGPGSHFSARRHEWFAKMTRWFSTVCEAVCRQFLQANRPCRPLTLSYGQAASRIAKIRPESLFKSLCGLRSRTRSALRQSRRAKGQGSRNWTVDRHRCYDAKAEPEQVT